MLISIIKNIKFKNKIKNIPIKEQRRIIYLKNRCEESFDKIKCRNKLRKEIRKFFRKHIFPVYINNPNINKYSDIGITERFDINCANSLEERDIVLCITREVSKILKEQGMDDVKIHFSIGNLYDWFVWFRLRSKDY